MTRLLWIASASSSIGSAVAPSPPLAAPCPSRPCAANPPAGPSGRCAGPTGVRPLPARSRRQLAATYTDHNPPPFQGPNTGLDGARDAFTTATKIFSDWSHEIVQQFSDGDFVITRIVGHGRHTGDFLGIPPTNKDVQMEGIAIHRVVDGKIVEHWGQVDAMGMLMQMGAIPSPAG